MGRDTVPDTTWSSKKENKQSRNWIFKKLMSESNLALINFGSHLNWSLSVTYKVPACLTLFTVHWVGYICSCQSRMHKKKGGGKEHVALNYSHAQPSMPLWRTSGGLIWISCHEGMSGKQIIIVPRVKISDLFSVYCSICCVALLSSS